MSDAADLAFLRRAAEIGRLGALSVEPNPQVGAVVVRDGRIVGEGHHACYGEAHAEVVALRAAGDLSRGATLYVTLEPCSTTGKTPPCTNAIAAAAPARVVYAAEDPNPLHRGGARGELEPHGIAVAGPVAPDLEPTLLRRFRRFLESKNPYVIAKWAMTLDGKIATSSGESKWITQDAARARVHELRGHVDAIAVGCGTVCRDRPLLTARPAGPRAPLRIVFDRGLLLPPDWQALRDGGPRVIVVGGSASDLSSDERTKRIDRLRTAGAEVLLAGGVDRKTHVETTLPILRDLGVARLLVEGGEGLLGAFFDARAVDQVCVYVAPRLVGGERAPSPVGGDGAPGLATAARVVERSITSLDDDLCIEGFVEN